MSRWFFLALILALVLGTQSPGVETTRTSRPVVFKAVIADEGINPATARFIDRAIREATQADAECLILVLDTPGGLVSSTRKIVKAMLASPIPVVVYVYPPGGRAGSAGVFITLASHIAVMAPSTNIGAAHPVSIGGFPGSGSEEKSDKKPASGSGSPMKDKVLNDTVAWVRAIAARRGRNVDWAERTVKESLSVPASEALQAGAIDLIAEDLPDLLRQIDGRLGHARVAGGMMGLLATPTGAGPLLAATSLRPKALRVVSLPGQREVSLRTADAEIREVRMWWGESILGVLGNPTVAFLLLMFGFYGILFELYSPGWGVGGTVGVICLLLGFAALSLLPTNYVGLALLLLAIILFVAEAFVTSYGMLAFAGVICMLLGGLMLVESPAGFERVSLSVLIPMTLATAGITFFLVTRVIQAYRQKPYADSTLATIPARALEDFVQKDDHYVGHVHTQGEIWRAISATPVSAGEQLSIIRRDGLTLYVQGEEVRIQTPIPQEG